jgi:GTP-binding protein EngB required for normal cell division
MQEESAVMNLKEYEQEKFGIAEIIRSAQAVNTRDEVLQSECRDLLTRLAEDRFNLMVVGRFSRGKSTLINALLGGQHLPTGTLPLTSVITTVRYGSRAQVVVAFSDSRFTREVPLSQLAEFVTQQSNPGNVKNVAYAEIELPVEILRRGLFFVDSPGLGSSITENTKTTERFLPQADAFVLVTSHDGPLSEEEDRILHRIRLTNKKLFIVVNKKDTVGAEERREVLAFIAERLMRLSFSGVPRVFSVSARQALSAKQAGDKDRLEESGLRSFEAELLRFLTEERAQFFLSNMYGQATDFLERRSRSENQAGNEKSFSTLVGRLRDHRERSLGRKVQTGKVVAADGATSSPEAPLHMEKRFGCWICSGILDAIIGFLSTYQLELTIDPESQRQNASRGGFCPLHTWQYENISSPYGVCTAYPKLAHRIAGELDRLAGQTSDANLFLEDLRGLLATSKTCRVCEIRIAAEINAVKIAVRSIRDATASGKAPLPACCLPHLVLVADSLGAGQPARSLVRSHARLLERTSEDLQRYALRHDALRRQLTSEEERRASQLALLLLGGHRSVSAPWEAERP